MTTLIPTAILLISLTTAAGASADELRGPQWRAEVLPSASSDAGASALFSAARAAVRDQDPWERALQSVFVVPGPDVAAEGLAQITEDIAIMCRILDKATASGRAGRGVDAALWLDSASGVFVGDRLSAQGLYLDGYGALFFIDVDFPLVPPVHEQTEAEAAPAGDSVWSATVNELRGVPQERSEAADPEYDAQKVENLKAIVTKALRHAANLRTRGPDTVVSVVVHRRMNRTNVNDLLGQVYGYEYHLRGSGNFPGSSSDLSAVLILRTTKADVDALAKGELTQEQFTGKVQVLKSWSSLGPEATPGSGSRSNIVVPSRVRR